MNSAASTAFKARAVERGLFGSTAVLERLWSGAVSVKVDLAFFVSPLGCSGILSEMLTSSILWGALLMVLPGTLISPSNANLSPSNAFRMYGKKKKTHLIAVLLDGYVFYPHYYILRGH